MIEQKSNETEGNNDKLKEQQCFHHEFIYKMQTLNCFNGKLKNVSLSSNSTFILMSSRTLPFMKKQYHLHILSNMIDLKDNEALLTVLIFNIQHNRASTSFIEDAPCTLSYKLDIYQSSPPSFQELLQTWNYNHCVLLKILTCFDKYSCMALKFYFIYIV